MKGAAAGPEWRAAHAHQVNTSTERNASTRRVNVTDLALQVHHHPCQAQGWIKTLSYNLTALAYPTAACLLVSHEIFILQIWKSLAYGLTRALFPLDTSENSWAHAGRYTYFVLMSQHFVCTIEAFLPLLMCTLEACSFTNTFYTTKVTSSSELPEEERATAT